MNDITASIGRVRLSLALVMPLAVGAWLALGTTASAAPSARGAANQATVTDTAAAHGSAHGGGVRASATHETSATHANAAHGGGHTNAASTGSADHSVGTAGTSGDPSKPQPLSGADQNTGGANGQCPGGPYCSTRDGSASGNGNGGGQAVGKPCAGCVGKADNKNPNGQKPDASDHNNGYECDGNHGIARTNPAHTGCTPPPAECVPTEENNFCEQPPECVPTEENNFCEQPPECVPTEANNFCTDVEGEQHHKPDTDVLGEKTVKTPAALPFTGAAGLGLMVSSGVIALTVGAGLMAATRRRRKLTG